VALNQSTPSNSVSAGLTSISQGPQQSLTGYAAAYYLPQEDLLQAPVVVNGAVVGDLVLASGAGWRLLPHTRHTLKFDEKPKPERGGTMYQVKVQAQRPTPSPAVLAGLAGLDRRRLLLLLQERGGALRLVGSRDEYVRLLASTEGSTPATRAGVDLELAGDTTRLAPYYRGAVPVLDGTPPVAAATGGGNTTIRDVRGNVLLTVPAGTDLIVASPFAVAFTIQS
jgi:hypothetical protein